MTIHNKATRIRLMDFRSVPMRAFHMTWFAFFLCFFGWFGIAPLMPVVRQELQLTKEQIGNTIIASVAITIIARLLIGWVCDRTGPRKAYTWLLLLGSLPVVGIGSVCRRQRMAQGREIVGRLSRLGIRLHGFGVKVTGLRDVAHQLVSADSMAWSLRARRGGIRLPGCAHKRCANCARWALVWRDRVLRAIAAPKQEGFTWDEVPAEGGRG